MKAVLEEVQLEVKREEEKRSELQLQYTRDKYSWEVEKAEFKRRIAQVTPPIVVFVLLFFFKQTISLYGILATDYTVIKVLCQCVICLFACLLSSLG